MNPGEEEEEEVTSVVPHIVHPNVLTISLIVMTLVAYVSFLVTLATHAGSYTGRAGEGKAYDDRMIIILIVFMIVVSMCGFYLSCRCILEPRMM